MSAPTVKVTPDFKVGEAIICKSSREEFELLAITPAGDLVCKGRAGIMPKQCAEKKI